MTRLNKIGILILILALPALFQTCKKNDYQYQYVNLEAFFPYMTKAFEENTYPLIQKNIKKLRHMLKGFRIYKRRQPIVWAVEKESSITAYFSHLTDKTVMLTCTPFNPSGQPHQAAEIFINGNHLKKIEFAKEGQYNFNIPAGFLLYGSNRISFKWEFLRSPKDFGMNDDNRKYALGLSYIQFQNKSQKNAAQKRKTLSKIGLNRKSKPAMIEIPHGGIIEYFIPLPERSCLRFKLSSRQKYLENSIFHAAVYNEKGDTIIQHFKSDSFHSQKEHQINLDGFARQTVRVVFANSIQNHPNFTMDLIRPAIYSAGKDLPGFLPVKDNKERNKKSGNQKQKKITKSPHVFIYLIDTLRADHLSCYGYFRETSPYIDRFSKSAVLFSHCFATASWTKPAVGSILTGLYPNKHRGEDHKDKLSTDVDMISEILKAHGYTTIYITPNMNNSREVNFDQGNDFYRYTIGGKYGEDFYRSSEFLNREFFKIMATNRHLPGKPLFAFLHTVDPHDPYTPESPFLKFKKTDKQREKLGFPDSIRLRKKTTGLNQQDIDYIKSLYDCEILHNDYYFGKWIEFLKEKNLYEDAIIVLVADHGEQFNEHGSLFHGYSIYNEEIHVPLIIKFPHGEFSGLQTDVIVSQVDIVPTIADYLGIEISSDVDGVSIFNILNHQHFHRSVFVREKLNRGYDKSNFVGIINTANKNKHILTYRNHFFTKAVNIELYDIKKDFAERRGIFAAENLFLVKSVQFLADYFLEKMKSSRFKEEKQLDVQKLDPEKIKQLKALGYIN